MMAHSEATRNMDARNFLGNLVLLIVGGNDTTRNTLSGSVMAMSENLAQYKRLRENPALIDSFVPEVIRWRRRSRICAALRLKIPKWAARNQERGQGRHVVCFG